MMVYELSAGQVLALDEQNEHPEAGQCLQTLPKGWWYPMRLKSSPPDGTKQGVFWSETSIESRIAGLSEEGGTTDEILFDDPRYPNELRR